MNTLILRGMGLTARVPRFPGIEVAFGDVLGFVSAHVTWSLPVMYNYLLLQYVRGHKAILRNGPNPIIGHWTGVGFGAGRRPALQADYGIWVGVSERRRRILAVSRSLYCEDIFWNFVNAF